MICFLYQPIEGWGGDRRYDEQNKVSHFFPLRQGERAAERELWIIKEWKSWTLQQNKTARRRIGPTEWETWRTTWKLSSEEQRDENESERSPKSSPESTGAACLFFNFFVLFLSFPLERKEKAVVSFRIFCCNNRYEGPWFLSSLGCCLAPFAPSSRLLEDG